MYFYFKFIGVKSYFVVTFGHRLIKLPLSSDRILNSFVRLLQEKANAVDFFISF